MTKDLSCFFPEQVKKRDLGFTVPVSNRFLNADGNVIEWEFKFPTHEIFKKIKEAGQKQVVKNGKIKFEFDQDDMFKEAIIECIEYPDLKNAKLQDAYKALDATELLKKMLYPDEVEKLGREVSVKIGLIENPAELLENAKN